MLDFVGQPKGAGAKKLLVVHICNPRTREGDGEDCYKFEANLGYIVPGQPRLQGEILSQRHNNIKCNYVEKLLKCCVMCQIWWHRLVIPAVRGRGRRSLSYRPAWAT